MPVQHRGKLGWHLGLDAECPECTGSAGPNPVPPRSQLDPLAARFGPRSAENPNAPDPQDLLRELHRAVHGDFWARPDSPADVWRELIRTVEAWRRAILSTPGSGVAFREAAKMLREHECHRYNQYDNCLEIVAQQLVAKAEGKETK